MNYISEQFIVSAERWNMLRFEIINRNIRGCLEKGGVTNHTNRNYFRPIFGIINFNF